MDEGPPFFHVEISFETEVTLYFSASLSGLNYNNLVQMLEIMFWAALGVRHDCNGTEEFSRARRIMFATINAVMWRLRLFLSKRQVFLSSSIDLDSVLCECCCSYVRFVYVKTSSEFVTVLLVITSRNVSRDSVVFLTVVLLWRSVKRTQWYVISLNSPSNVHLQYCFQTMYPNGILWMKCRLNTNMLFDFIIATRKERSFLKSSRYFCTRHFSVPPKTTSLPP